VDGFQFCQDSGATVCGSVTVSRALSSKPGWSLSVTNEPNSQPGSNETMLAAGPRLVAALAVRTFCCDWTSARVCALARPAPSSDHVAAPAAPPAAVRRKTRLDTSRCGPGTG